ncbi:MAG: diphosphomevalonate decarboxylase [bacterium]
MADEVRARAHANIALSKYWGKRETGDNVPATPSISLALDRLATDTTVRRIDAPSDSILLNGSPASELDTERLRGYLDLWRGAGLIDGSFQVDSTNHFPTSAGLASSSSGFAALATALAALAERPLDSVEISRLARRGSASAARSVTGGLSELLTGDDPASDQVLPPDKVPWGMVVAVVDASAKETGSTEGMQLSRTTSPFYAAWVDAARNDFHRIREACLKFDLEIAGSVMEANMYAMHSVMLSTRPALLYWTGTSLALLREVRSWRKGGLAVWATVDAGPHVVFLTQQSSLDTVAKLAVEIPGVRETFSCLPAPGARVVA